MSAAVETIDTLKAAVAALTERITKFEIVRKALSVFPLSINAPDVAEGETFVATIITPTQKYHLIALPDDLEPAPWQTQMDIAKSKGADLPDRIEQAMLFAHFKDQFKKEWYWSNTRHASGSGFAWVQYFDHGNQGAGTVSTHKRARLVRRSFI